MLLQIIEKDKIIVEVAGSVIPKETLQIKVGDKLLNVEEIESKDGLTEIYVKNETMS